MMSKCKRLMTVCGLWSMLLLGSLFRTGVARGEDAGAEAATVETPAKSISESNAAPVEGKNARGVPKRAPVPSPTSEQLELSIRRGVDFLLQDQNKNGSWGSATKTKDLNIYAPVPGSHQAFRAAVTALVVSALIEVNDSRPEVQLAIQRGETFLIEHLEQVRRATGDAIYNVWTHGFAIETLTRLHQRHVGETAKQEQLANLIQHQIGMLERYESVDGGWGYYDFNLQTKKPASSSISFTTATILVAMHDAQALGVEPPKKLTDRAIAATRRQRLPDFSYLYGEYLKWQPRRGINRPSGSLGRSQACNLAMRYWGDDEVTQEVLEDWLDRLFARNGWLDIGRKRPIPHESWEQVAGYFYFYGHYYAARCIEELPVSMRAEYQAHMFHTIAPKQERDGSWLDFPFYDYGHPYATAFALRTLARCRPVKE
ncbi:MAG: prenyltransferase/squalene oxidase repeat-containing protein [Planctomycetaceae bacterium]